MWVYISFWLLFCVSLITSDAGMCWSFACLWEKCPFMSSAHFKIRLSFCFWVVWVPCIVYFEYECLYQISSLQVRLPCVLLIAIFAVQKLLNSVQSHLLIFASVACAFSVLVSHPKKSLPSPMWKNKERNSVMGQIFHSSLETKMDWEIEIFMFLFKDAFFLFIELEGERMRERREREIKYSIFASILYLETIIIKILPSSICWTVGMIVCFLSYTTCENDSKYFNQQKRDQKGKKHNQPTKQIGVVNNYKKQCMEMSQFPRCLYIPNSAFCGGGVFLNIVNVQICS